MKDVTARQFFRCHIRSIPAFALGLGVMEDHFFPADDTCSIAHGCQFFLCGVGIALVHISGGCLITVERFEARYERAGCDVYVPDDVERKAIEGNNDSKE